MKPSRFPALVSELVLPRFGSSTLGLQCGGFNSDSRGLHTAASIRTDSSPPGCPADPIHPPAMPASQLPGWKSLPTSLAPHATGKDWSHKLLWWEERQGATFDAMTLASQRCPEVPDIRICKDGQARLQECPTLFVAFLLHSLTRFVV